MIDNTCIIFSIIILSGILYYIVLNNTKKEFYINYGSSSNMKCAKKISPETHLYSRMLEKRGEILGEIGDYCFNDIDCKSRYCNDKKCAPLCTSKINNDYLTFKL